MTRSIFVFGSILAGCHAKGTELDDGQDRRVERIMPRHVYLPGEVDKVRTKRKSLRRNGHL